MALLKEMRQEEEFSKWQREIIFCILPALTDNGAPPVTVNLLEYSIQPQ